MTPPTPAKPLSLSQRTIRGVAWTLPASLCSRMIGLAGTLILARYLAPAEYGEVSAAAIVTMTANSVTTFGIGIYLMMNRDVSRAEAFHASCWYIATGVVAFALATASSGPLGRWFGAPGLGRFMPVLVLGAILDRVSFLPERALIRQMRFREISLARASSELAYTALTLALAAHGVGAMAIAWGNLARSALRFAIIVPVLTWREWIEPHRLRLATMIKIIRYGVDVALTTMASFAMSRWDNLLISRYFGPAVMGAYNYAYNLADAPALAIGEQVSDVVGVSFVHVEREKRPAALVRSLTMISLIMLPLAFGLGAVAETASSTFFDQKWSSVGSMLLFLSVLPAARPMTHILNAYLYACGRPRVVLCLECLGLAAVVGGIATVGRIGVGTACCAVGVAFVLRTLAGLWTIHRLDAVPMASFLRPLARPFVACVLMVIAIVAARPALHGLSPAVRLVIEVSLGAAVYGAGALLIYRSASRELIGLARSVLSRR